MRHGSLFSGIGGFDLASSWMGWENVFHCEWNEFGKRVLKYYWPNAISYDDITKTDFSIHRGNIDILTGGFPCQPYSMAGKRKGKEDERHLWPEMLRAIQEIQPTWVVGENVPGLINWNGGMVFDEVQTDLENAGYEVIPFVLPAAGVNAPHRRDRIWFVGYRYDANGNSKGARKTAIREVCNRESSGTGAICEIIENSISDGCLQREPVEEGTEIREQQHVGTGDSEWVCKSADAGNAVDTMRDGLTGQEYREKKSGWFAENGIRTDWQNFPTQPPICSRNDGISTKLAGITVSKHRNESIKGYGNTIVPKVVYQIYQAIEHFNKLTNEKQQAQHKADCDCPSEQG